jgi:hypothetical protein
MSLSTRKRHTKILQGRDLFLIAGLPKPQLESVISNLCSDATRAPAQYRGAPAPVDDWGPIYPPAGVKMLIIHAVRSVSADDTKEKDAVPRSLPTPRRIFLLYVDTHDAENLLRKTDFFCLPMPLAVESGSSAGGARGRGLVWRHTSKEALRIIKETIGKAQKIADHLKGEVTDRTKSALALPTFNFCLS